MLRVNGSLFLLAALALFTCGLVVTEKVANGFAILFILLGLSHLLVRYQSSVGALSRPVLVVFACFGYFSFVSLLVYLWWGGGGAYERLERYIVLMPACLMFFYFIVNDLSIQRVVLVFELSLVFISVVAIAQFASMYFFSERILTFGVESAQFWLRPSGAVHPMRFSAILLMLLCFIWLGREVAGRSGGALFFLSLLLGVVALILTQTRGTWLAGLMCIAVFVLNYVCSKKFFFKFKSN